MFTLIDRETNTSRTINTQSKIELTYSEDWISVNISVWSREDGVSINSEWLTMKINAIPKNDFRLIEELKIEETTDSEVKITGKYADAFRTGDDMGFYYYVNQSLFPEHSQSSLRYVSGKKFRFQHQSVNEYYEFKVDTEIELSTLTAKAWNDEQNPKQRIMDLKKFFEKNFDPGMYSAPTVEETGTCSLLTYTAI